MCYYICRFKGVLVMSEVLLHSKRLIEAQIVQRKILLPDGFGADAKAYAATNENIDGYMNTLNFRGNDKVFSVLGSGDQAFNAILNGARDIDTFDTCPLSMYFALGIKRSAIMAFSYQEFLKFSRRIVDPKISLGELISYIEFLYPYMEREHQDYWKAIVDYNFKLQKWHFRKINLMQMLLVNTRGLFVNTFKNTYLKNEEEYNKLRNRIGKANITFRQADIFNHDGNADKKYDFILLSNILDYAYNILGEGYQYSDLDFFKKKLCSMMSNDGIMCFAYLISCYHDGKLNDNLFLASNVSLDALGCDELHLIPHIVNNKVDADVKDGIILVRKK